MTKNWRAQILAIISTLSCLAGTSVWAQAFPPPGKAAVLEKKQGPQPTTQELKKKAVLTGECNLHDKVEITDFSLSPFPPSRQQAVTVRLVIRNLCDVALPKVEWQIACTTYACVPVTVPSGTPPPAVAPVIVLNFGVAAIPARQTVTVTAPWTAVPGQTKFDSRIDPRNFVGENTHPRNLENNHRTMTINVAVGGGLIPGGSGGNVDAGK